MNLGSFMGAVGDSFRGYALDQQNRSVEADRLAQQSLRDREARKLDREEADDALLRSPEFGMNYARAFTSGDPTAIGQVGRMVIGHPQGAQIMATLTKEPKPDATTYDSERGVLVNRNTGTFTPLRGLPPRAQPPAVGVAPSPIRTVEKQLDNARTDLHQLRSTRKPLSPLSSSSDSALFNQSVSAEPRLRARVDSLSGVFDRMAADEQGRHIGKSTSKPPLSLNEYRELRALGHSDADIRAQYEIRN